MGARRILHFASRLAAAISLALLPTGCFVLEGPPPANPLIGTWSNADNDRVTFSDSSVVVTPNSGKAVTMGPSDCNGVFKVSYGRMATVSFATMFPTQPDLEAQLKKALVAADYPVADVTCDQGGTTYFMLDDRQVLAVYRDSGIGGLEHLTRL
jgi:hypothetical protein